MSNDKLLAQILNDGTWLDNSLSRDEVLEWDLANFEQAISQPISNFSIGEMVAIPYYSDDSYTRTNVLAALGYTRLKSASISLGNHTADIDFLTPDPEYHGRRAIVMWCITNDINWFTILS